MRIDQLFLDEVPRHILQRLAEGFRAVYARTEAVLMETLLFEEQRRNLRPWLRRELTEQMLRLIAEEHPSIVQWKCEVDQSNFWFHVSIKIGRFWLTQHTMQSEDTTLRPAGYKERAAKMNQSLLFDDAFDIVDGTASDAHWAVILHKRTLDNTPDVLKILFPKADLAEGFCFGEIDLISEFPAVFNEQTAETEIEVIVEPTSPEIIFPGSAEAS